MSLLTLLGGTCGCQASFRLVNYFPVCWLFTLFFSVPAEAIVRSFGVKTQDLPLFMDPEREGGYRRSYEEPEEGNQSTSERLQDNKGSALLFDT